jgi:uncharacterized protein (DUF1501 family)
MTTRRLFLKQGLFATAGLSLLAQARMVEAATLSNRIVVFLYLFGGNDGLNMIVPMNQYSTYQQLRPNLHIPQSKLLVPPGTQIGFNPAMTKLYSRFVSNGTGKANVAVLNGIAMPTDSVGLFDHVRCQYAYQSCDVYQTSGATKPEGWIGKYFKNSGADIRSLTGVNLGDSQIPLQYSGYTPTSIVSINDFYVNPSFDTTALQSYINLMNIPATNPIAEYNRTIRVQALADSNTARQATSTYVATTAYPNSTLGNGLKNCAQLLYSNSLGIRAVTVGTGGFDTHQNQNYGASSTTLGYHDQLLQDVSDCIDAFFSDLEALGIADNVLLVTMSDFGRNIAENSSLGTDHGYASTSFVIGKSVVGGVYNDYPDLTNANLTNLTFSNKLYIQSDFRSVYTTIAARFLGADPVLVTGGNFPLIGFLA